MMITNQTDEQITKQDMIATNQANEVREKPTDMMTEKPHDKPTRNEVSPMNAKEIADAAREKAKEEEERSSGLWEIRARFKNLAEKILPKHPYLMGIPSKVRVSTHEGPDWRRGTPFSPHEERVQYVSFHRLDDEDTVLRPQSWDEENTRSSQSDSTRRASSEFSLPGQTPRKKLSMEEYFRRKTAGSGSANASREGSSFPPVEAKISPEGTLGRKIESKISTVESVAFLTEGNLTQECISATTTQEKAVVAAIGPDMPAENIDAPEKVTQRKEVMTQKGVTKQAAAMVRKEVTMHKAVTTHKEVAMPKEVATQKGKAMPHERRREEVVAKENEIPAEKEANRNDGAQSHSRKRPIEAIAPAANSTASSHHQISPLPKKPRISPSPKALGKRSSPKPTNAHGFPPLLSPTLPPSIEKELANLEAPAIDVIDEKAHSGKISDARTLSPRKELPQSDGISRHTSPIPPPSSNIMTAASKPPGSNGPKSKIAEAAQNSMFFGQPRRVPPPKKAEVIPQRKSMGKKAEPVPKAEKSRVKVAERVEAKGTAKETARQPEPIAKQESPSKPTEPANAKRAAKDVGSDLKGPAITASGPNSILDAREKKSSIVILKIPRSKRKACQALLRFSPRPRKPNGIPPTLVTASKELNKTEAQRNVGGKRVENDQTAQKRPVAAATPPRQEFRGVEPNHRGQKRPPPAQKADPEPSQKRSKPSTDGDHVAATSLPPAEREDPAFSSKESRPVKDPPDRIEKRPRPAEKDDAGPSKKRSKLSGDVHPGQPVIKSANTVPASSASKSNVSSPKAELKSAAMRRIASLDGEAQTPSAALREGTPTAPGSAERAPREGRPTSATTSSAASWDEVISWRAEQQRYLDLGVQLKHELDGIVKRDGVLMKDPIANKQGCPIGVESILCWMLGFTALDEVTRVRGRVGSSSVWGTLLPLIDYVKAITSSASHIYGLILQLEGICRDTIHAYDLDRLEREPSAASDPKFTGQLIENARAAQRAWLAGTTGLSINDLQKSFPKTWAKRASAPTGSEKLAPGTFAAGRYYLPLTSTSTAVEAVKMGWSFLAEWAEMEGVEWKGRMF